MRSLVWQPCRAAADIDIGSRKYSLLGVSRAWPRASAHGKARGKAGEKLGGTMSASKIPRKHFQLRTSAAQEPASRNTRYRLRSTPKEEVQPGGGADEERVVVQPKVVPLSLQVASHEACTHIL